MAGNLESELEAKFLETQKINQGKRDQFREKFKLTLDSHSYDRFDKIIQTGKDILTSNKIKFKETNQKSLIITPDPNHQHPFVQLANSLMANGFKLEVAYPGSSIIPNGGMAAVNHETKTLRIPMSFLSKMNDPEVIGVIQHEKRHIIESLRGSDASKLSLKVIQSTQNDAVNMGYGKQFFYRLDEPFSFYQGGAITKAASNGNNIEQLVQGESLTWRLSQILAHRKDSKNNMTYNKKTGEVTIEIHTPSTDQLVSGSPQRSGVYHLVVKVEPDLDKSRAIQEGNKIVDRYFEKLQRIKSATERLINNN